jgi:tryptophan halogenase
MAIIDKIVIVGGGTAGWMTAATLIKHYPNKDITLIESADVPTVGVGESTIGGINDWLNSLGINEDDWMKACDASLKLSIKFTDWAGKGSGGFHYPFGEAWTVGTSHGINDWYIKKAWYPATPVTDFCDSFYPQMAMVHQNKVIKNENDELPGWRYDRDVAYHFDAAKFGLWLRESYCKPRGVKHIVGTINEDIATDANGIQYVELTTGEKITADLYIDCTGWKSLLLGKALNVPFVSYSDFLPNNSAWATRLPYTDKVNELEGYTNCTAIDNGWVWNIPLWSRIGTGYVYSDKYISKEDALEEFKNYLRTDRQVKVDPAVVDSLEYRAISMRVGIHEELFVKNVCAIGLSAGFIEPLESNGLFTVHEFLHQLVKTLSRRDIGRIDKLGFNKTSRGAFDAFAEFVGMHYTLSQRSDTKYWLDAKERIGTITHEVGNYKSYGTDNAIFKRDYSSSFDNSMGGLPPIATGLNYFPVDLNTISRTEFRYKMKLTYIHDVFDIWESNKIHWKTIADNAPTLLEYLTAKYDNSK